MFYKIGPRVSNVLMSTSAEGEILAEAARGRLLVYDISKKLIATFKSYSGD